PARARRLPAADRAVVVRHTPFVIRLRDRTVAGSVVIRTRHGLVQGIHHRHVRLLQRADGYGYTTRPEARHCAAFPPPPAGGGIHAGSNR
ncbi:hypothetical protein ABZ260_49685, partial [Streptosporangium sp. NPDC006013]|uniref:hypothetical protein n=1 Tax=Streptosporangium sp. NPDC006013 TaxID=3155596 RepID=UPI0033A934B2